MDVRNNLDGLRSLLGINQTVTAAPQSKGNAAAGAATAWEGDHATLSTAASEIAQVGPDEAVRTEKVAAVQSALASGTYNVPASAVAPKLIDAMLSSGR